MKLSDSKRAITGGFLREKPLTRFRVYAPASVLFFHVYVWRTQAELIRSRERRGLKRTQCSAYTYTYKLTDKKTRRVLPIIGEIHLWRAKLFADVAVEAISHEAFHAALALHRRFKGNFTRWEDWNTDDTSEELVVWIAGLLAKYVYAGLEKRALINMDWRQLRPGQKYVRR